MIAMRTSHVVCNLLVCMLLIAGGCTRTATETAESRTDSEAIEKSAAQKSGATSINRLGRDIDVDGTLISVGHRGSAEPGQTLDTIVTITKDDKSVAGAMVFYQIVSPDGGSTLSPEVATVLEPASGGNPPCFAQGRLDIPEDIVPVAVRVRIILPNVDKEWTKDFLLPGVTLGSVEAGGRRS